MTINEFKNEYKNIIKVVKEALVIAWDERFLLIEAGILPEGFDKPAAELFASRNWYKSVDPEIMNHVNLLLEAVHEFCPSCNYSFSEFCWELKK